MGEDVDAAPSSAARRCTSATASATSSRRRRSTPRCSPATCSTTCPSTAGAPAQRWPAVGPPGGAPDARGPRRGPQGLRRARRSPRALVDGGRLLEVSPRWARNMVCAFARLDGRAVGIVANQPRHLGGVLDADAATEGGALRAHLQPVRAAARRARRHARASCPAPRQEQAGVIRHGAKLVHAFAEASVPRVTVILRKAFGGAFIAMNSKELGADLVFAWPRRADRRHGRPAGGRHHRPPRDRRRRRPRPRARAPRRAATPPST